MKTCRGCESNKEGYCIGRHKWCFMAIVDCQKDEKQKTKVPRLTGTRSRNAGIKIKCIQTGEVFGTIRAAAATMKLGEKEISLHLRKIKKAVKGFTFKEV